jgi:hypothetical protein
MQNQNNENVRIVVFLLVVVAIIWCYNGWRLQYVKPQPKDALLTAYNDNLFNADTSNIKTIVASMSKEDRERLSKFYKAFAMVVSNDDSTRNYITHSSMLKEINARAGVLCFGKDLLGKYKGLSDEVDEYLRASIGVDKEHRTLTVNDRKKAVTALEELSSIFQAQ